MMDRKIVEYLVMGKPHRWIKEQLGVGAGRLAKVQALAEAHGYLSGQALPGYPQALFADRVDHHCEQPSQADTTLLARKAWIEERLRAGWKAVTVFEELRLPVTRSSFYRFLERHRLDRLSREARVVRVVPEIVHRPGDALILDWGKLCTVIDPRSGAKRALWVMIAVLGFSRYLCARVVWRNDVTRTLSAIESMWQELGGVSSRLTSDNPKCFALTACRYEPVLNPAFERFAAHYGSPLNACRRAIRRKKARSNAWCRTCVVCTKRTGSSSVRMNRSSILTANSSSPINVVMARLSAGPLMI
jgi:transposase